nr:MAG TPA: hypothetical protein [Caudoviricetes sp.]
MKEVYCLMCAKIVNNILPYKHFCKLFSFCL